MVTISPFTACIWRPLINAWWAQVTDTPDDNKIILFSKGTPKGSKATIPIGGQLPPSSMLGLRLLWKYLQKKDKKKNTSEIINNSIPLRRPSSTMKECLPINPPSRDTSRHHWKVINKRPLSLNRANPLEKK